jgi:hypothetical protein
VRRGGPAETDGQPPPWPPYVPLPQPYRPGGLRRLGNPLDWVPAAGAAIAFGCSFATFYTATATLGAVAPGLPAGPQVLKAWAQQADAWHGVFGWLAAVLALVAAVVSVVAPGRLLHRIVALGAAATATGFIVVAAVVTPSLPVEDQGRAALRQARGFGLDVRLSTAHGRGVGFWVAFAAIVLTLLVIVGRLRADVRRG